MFDERIHPKYVIVLSFEFKLIADEKAQFLFSLILEFFQCFLKDCVELFFDVGCFGVNFFDFEIDFAEIVCELIFSTFDVGIDFFDIGGDLRVCFFEFDRECLAIYPLMWSPKILQFTQRA
jgi:hypothetical protein